MISFLLSFKNSLNFSFKQFRPWRYEMCLWNVALNHALNQILLIEDFDSMLQEIDGELRSLYRKLARY